MSNIEKIQVQSLNDLYHRCCEGHHPKKPLDYNGRYSENNRWGPGRRFSLKSENGKSGVLTDHKIGKSVNWCLKDHTFKKSTSKKTKKQKKATEKEIKDISKEFKKFKIVHTHPYSATKQVSIADLKFRTDKFNNLLIPFYSLKTHFMSGWQVIFPQADEEGKWPKRTRKGSSNKDVYLPLGETKKGESINVGEGPSTCLSLFKISRRMTYIVFGKNNLQNVALYLAKKHPNKMINVYLDFDKDQFIPKIRHRRIRFFRPDEEGDFNTHQHNPNEIEKIKNCTPVYTLPKRELPKDALDLKKKFESFNWSVRLNTRKDRIEIKGFKGEEWQELIDEEYSRVFLEYKDNTSLTKTKFDDRIKAVASDTQVDPFLSYLEGLEWDGEARLKDVLTTLFDVEDKYKPLAEWAFRSILLASVRRAYQAGSKHDEFCILQGPQGIGKSSLFYYLFENKSFYSNSINFNDKTKDFVEGLQGKVLIECSELVGLKKTERERMKALITAQQDSIRLSYRKNPRDYPRQNIFVGTTNSENSLPDDQSGNRRFIIIEVKKKMGYKDLIKHVEDHRDQWWAEAVELYNKGEPARLPKELWDTSAEVAEAHRGGDFIFEEAFLEEVVKEEKRAEYVKEDEVEIHISGILKTLQDGIVDGEGKVIRKGGWIKLHPGYWHKGNAIMSKREGYKTGRRIRNGRKLRLWIKKIEVKSPPKEVDIPQNTPPINEVKSKDNGVKVVKNSEVKSEDLGELSDILGPLEEVTLPSPEDTETPPPPEGPPPF